MNSLMSVRETHRQMNDPADVRGKARAVRKCTMKRMIKNPLGCDCKGKVRGKPPGNTSKIQWSPVYTVTNRRQKSGGPFPEASVITGPVKLFCFPLRVGVSKGLKIVQ